MSVDAVVLRSLHDSLILEDETTKDHLVCAQSSWLFKDGHLDGCWVLLLAFLRVNTRAYNLISLSEELTLNLNLTRLKGFADPI